MFSNQKVYSITYGMDRLALESINNHQYFNLPGQYSIKINASNPPEGSGSIREA